VDRSADRFRWRGRSDESHRAAARSKPPRSAAREIAPITPTRSSRRRSTAGAGRTSSRTAGYWSFWIFLILFFVSLFAELIANDRPFLIKFDGRLYWPAFVSYSETTFGGDFETPPTTAIPILAEADRDKGGTIVWPLIRYPTIRTNLDRPTPAPSKPTWMLRKPNARRWCRRRA